MLAEMCSPELRLHFSTLNFVAAQWSSQSQGVQLQVELAGFLVLEFSTQALAVVSPVQLWVPFNMPVEHRAAESTRAGIRICPPACGDHLG